MKRNYLFSALLVFTFLSCTKNAEIMLTPFTDGEKWGFIDADKNVVLTTKYDDALPFSEGLAAVKLGDKWGYINKKGEEIILPIKYDFAGSFHDKYAIVRQYNKWGFINKNGVEVIPPERYDFVSEYTDGLSIVCKDNLYGFINNKGKIIIEPKYDLVWNFSNGKAKVFQNQRFGYIDKNGKEIVPVKYDLIYNYKDGIALAKQNNRWSFINEEGDETLELFYDYIWEMDDFGFYKVFRNDKYGFINNEGEEIILTKYDYAEDFHNNVSIVKKNELYGLIDRYGKEIVPFTYKSIRPLNQVVLQTEKDLFETEYINPYGKMESNYNSFTDLVNTENIDQEDATAIFTDPRDNQEYHCVKIGSQIWMVENLRFQAEGSKCYETNSTDDCELYGRYYQWESIKEICPEGWRIPTDQDWKILINELGGEKLAYSQLISGGESGLNLRLGGYFYNQKSFENVDDYGYFWTATEDGSDKVICYWMNKNERSILQFSAQKSHLRNIRCIKK